MGPSDPGAKNLHLSIIDQTMFRSYVRIVMIFPFPHADKRLNATGALKRGLQATITHWPYLAGTTGPVDEDTNTFSLNYSDNVRPVGESGVFAASYLDDPQLSYKRLGEQGFSPSMIRVEDWVPALLRSKKGIESPVAEGRLGMTQPIPVLAMQAFFIDGGLVLSFYSHHGVIDGGGFSAFATRLAGNIRLEKESDAPDTDNPSASRLAIDTRIERVPPSVPSVNSGSTEVSSPTPSSPLDSHPIPDCTPRLFTFSRTRLAELREELRQHVDNPETLTIFQTLAGLIWTHFTRARKPRVEPASITQCAVAVNLRSRLCPPLDENFIGNASTIIAAPLVAGVLLEGEKVSNHTISIAAAAVRAKIESMSPDASLAHLARLRSATCPDDLYEFNYPQDVFITSWASFDFGGLVADWGIPGAGTEGVDGGRVTVRKPFSNQDRSVLLYPRPMDETSPYEVLVQLRKDDMDRLINEDGGLTMWAERFVE
ncbi:uncharacterized protein BDZ99DRAFT_469669 [Mytilinidion resinicola]|uniref:Trichothecene 3-O-acetyltransferase n=1 Tax=Mytilinidion resinicola TaxID=574789 RepID=A0A6A6Y0Z7_9PEZI|nr:uncharacterized protein BDZ99DRAFT_469669 [Mytilinidion resinicola]KAF2801487.1 hypothetical protein BDZ99DRAFT_469669 [Mytilinidion resinicola]